MTALLAEARGLLERARIAPRVLWQTGMLRGARPEGVLALLQSRGKANPSMVMRYHARNTPQRTALIHGEQRYSYYELDQHIDRLARALASRGTRPGHALAIALSNVPELIVAQAAIGRLGARAVTVSWRSTAAELRYLLADSGARALFFQANTAEPVLAAVDRDSELARHCYAVGGQVDGLASYDELIQSAAPGEVAPIDDGEEAAVVIYTSGTTGKPKGAVRRFKQGGVASVLGFIGETPMHSGQSHLVVCPLYHSTAFGFASLSFVLGSTVVLLDRFEPDTVLAAIERHRIDHTAMVPTMLHRLLELGDERIRQYDTSSLSAIFTGGAPLSAALAGRIMDTLGDKLYQFYGATETGLVTLAKPADMRAAPGTIGRCLPGNQIRLITKQGTVAAPGEVGELYVASGNLVEGYHNNAAATDAATLAGYFSVGDLARVDAAGRYFIEGRKRDMIISGGVNVYPREVEDVLCAHPGVDEAAVVGVPDEQWGERVHAFVVPRSGQPGTDQQPVDAAAQPPLLAALDELARERLAGPKRPRGYTLLARLPRNPTGKVLKRELAAQAATDPPAEAALSLMQTTSRDAISDR